MTAVRTPFQRVHGFALRTSGAIALAALLLSGCSKEPEVTESPARVRLITQQQYINTITSIFGDDINITVHFAPVRRTDGLLALGASSAGTTPSNVEQFQQVASAVAKQVLADGARREYVMPCKPENTKAADHACATQFLKRVGALLYRRPLRDSELARSVENADKVSDQFKDFYYGLSLALGGMLIDPDVLFIQDQTEADPDRPGHQRLTRYALATRLSLFLWNSGPDETLIEAATSGELYKKKSRERIIDKMMASPRFEVGMRAFFDDMLGFEDFDNLAKDPSIYPAFTGAATDKVREQALRTIVDHLLAKRNDYRDLFTSRDTFIDPTLAVLYGVQSPGPGWSRYQFPAESLRAGLLTEAAFLSVHSHPGRSSPTKRGRALREEFLCQSVPNPPPNVDFSAVTDPKSPLKTARERLAFHRSNAVCAGCHAITDPVGLALENFDGAGQFRTTERDTPIDASGTLSGHDFQDAAGLGKAIHDEPALTACITRRVYGYATGGPAGTGARPLLAYLEKRFAEQGYIFTALVKDIALSAAFSEISDAPVSPAKALTSNDTAANAQLAKQ